MSHRSSSCANDSIKTFKEFTRGWVRLGCLDVDTQTTWMQRNYKETRVGCRNVRHVGIKSLLSAVKVTVSSYESYYYCKLLTTDYALLGKILNVTAPLPTKLLVLETSVPPTTAEQKLARKNELRQRGLEIYEAEVMGSSSTSQNTQNVAFVSSNSTGSTNEVVKTAHGVSTANSKANASTLPNVESLSDGVIYSFFAKTAVVTAVTPADAIDKGAKHKCRYGYSKNHMKTIKNGQTRTRERKSVQEPEAKVKKSTLVNSQSTKVKVNSLEDKDPKVTILVPQVFKVTQMIPKLKWA
ncbi:hypothetical protein Tco_0769888 [Tanacetum coccineum]|uniref:Uncharacterized protein n=1 Tax=Tanacetum coccineum TaxID=301880 RepID=A0ABQ4ZE62_9ASTR